MFDMKSDTHTGYISRLGRGRGYHYKNIFTHWLISVANHNYTIHIKSNSRVE